MSDILDAAVIKAHRLSYPGSQMSEQEILEHWPNVTQPLQAFARYIHEKENAND